MKKTRNRHNTKINMKTLLTIMVLKLLSEKVHEDHYGNNIISIIEERLKIYRPSPGVIYPILNSLEVDEYVIGHWDDPIKKSVKRYRITDSGNVKLKSMLINYDPIIREEVLLLQNIAKMLEIEI